MFNPSILEEHHYFMRIDHEVLILKPWVPSIMSIKSTDKRSVIPSTNL